MVATSPVHTLANPSNLNQYVVLWGTGRIDSHGGVPLITGVDMDWYNRPDQPVGIQIMITNWATGAGYVLDIQGGFHALNGAPTITTQSGDTYVNNNGLIYVPDRRYAKWSWDPALNGQGYVMDMYGEIFEFGGATDAPRQGPRFRTNTVRGFTMQWTPTKKAYSVDASGAVWADFGATFSGAAAPYFAGQDVTRDLEISDWSNGSGYVLTGDGATHGFGTAPSPLTGGPYRKGMDMARDLIILSPANPVKFRQTHNGGEVFDYTASTPPTVLAGAGVNEQQLVTITGGPTGGTFTLTYSGQTTAAIARAATTAQVVSALEALSNIGVGDVAVTGAFPSWTVTFQGVLGRQDVAQMTGSGALLTGGTTPAVVVTTVTPGQVTSPSSIVTTTTQPVLTWDYNDPQRDSQAGYEVYLFTQAYVTANPSVGTDPTAHAANAVYWTTGASPTIRGVTPDIDLINGTYRYYVRAKDTADQYSGWSTLGWTQNVAVPATPGAVTATAAVGVNQWYVDLQVTTTSTGGATLVRFDYSQDAGLTWWPVRGATAVPRLTTTVAVDLDIPLGVNRRYRAVGYATAPRTASLPSASSADVHTRYDRLVYVLTHTGDTALGGEVMVVAAPEWSREQEAGVHQGAGAKFPIVIQDGGPKAQERTLTLEADRKAEWDKIAALIEKPGTLLLRDPFGDQVYCKIVGKITRVQKKLPRYPDEITPLRHNHDVVLPLRQVAPPVT